jgi:hypothetical protein
VGEFVFSDSATPITTATCQLTSFTPTGQPFLTATPLTGTADGWYAHTFSLAQDAALGDYPSQICCQTTENDICIDKTFSVITPPLNPESITDSVWNATAGAYTTPGTLGQQLSQLQNNTLSAADIWSYTGRTLSDFGSLVTDIWSSANRTLTGFGTLVSDVSNSVWSNPNRSITDTSNIVQDVWTADPSDYDADPDSFANKINTTTNLTAEEVWDYQTRSVTDTSNIAATVWDYQTRSLTTFGDLVTSIWSADNRTATDPSGATATSIDVLRRELVTATTLLQQISTSPQTGDLDSPDYAALLAAKLTTTKEYLDDIAGNTELINTKLGLLAVKWNDISDTDKIQELNQVITLLGNPEAENPTTIIGQITWLADNWNRPQTTDLAARFQILKEDVRDLSTAVQTNPDEASQQAAINDIFQRLTGIKSDIGNFSQSETSPSLFGFYKSTKALADALSREHRIITSTLTDWPKLPLADQDAAVTASTTAVTQLNRFTSLKSLLAPQTSTPEHLNNLLSVITANQAALAGSGKQPVVVNWIGQQATHYHTFVVNLNRADSQTATISYLLPKEYEPDHLISIDQPLKSTYDQEQQALTIAGSTTLDPATDQLLTVTTTDIWHVGVNTLHTLRDQAAQSAKALEKTPAKDQAAELMTQIDQALETIVALQVSSRTPTAIIQAARQVRTLITTIEAQLAQLNELVATENSTSSLKGFVGGIQAVAVWGMIVIFIAGFIFLSLYMRLLYQQTVTNPEPQLALSLPLSGNRAAVTAPATPKPASLPFTLPDFSFLTKRRFALSVVVLSSFLFTAITMRQVPLPTVSTPSQQAVMPLSETPPATSSALPIAPLEPVPSPTPAATASPSAQVLIIPPENQAITLYRLPTVTSTTVAIIDQEEPATVIGETDVWLKVSLDNRDQTISGWLQKTFAIILPN